MIISPTKRRAPAFDDRAPNLSLEAILEKHSTLIVAVTILGFFVFHSLFIYPRHVWYDEITTYYVARTFSWASITEALRLTADAQPPTYHLLQTPVLWLLGDDPHHLRWLTLTASCVSIGAVFIWLRRMTSAAAALAGVAMLAGSKLSFYAIEARPYALLLTAASLALASRGIAWRILWLMAAVSVHFYGVFVPLALALGDRSWRRRLLYGLAYFPLIFTMPEMHPPHLLTAGNPFEPTVLSLIKTLPVLAGGALYSLIPLIVAGVIWWIRHNRQDLFRGQLFQADLTSWALVAIAPVCWLMGVGFTDIFCMRYAIVSILGLAGLVAWFVQRLPHRAIVSTVFFVSCLSGSLATQKLLTMESWDSRPTARLIDETLAASPRPVVMGDSPYLDLYYYARPESRKRFVRLTVDPPSFTTEYAYHPGPEQYARWSEMIGKYAGFTPIGLDDWLARHSSFVVVAESESDWVLEACRKRGAQVTWIRSGDRHRFYSVEFPAR